VRICLFRCRRGLRRVALCGITLVACSVAVPLPAGVEAAGQPAATTGKSIAEGKESRKKISFEESWQVIHIGKSRVGFGRSSIETQERDGRELVVSDTEMSMAITRFGQEVKTKTQIRTEETPAGDLLAFQFELLNAPAAPTRKTGRVENGRLIIDTEVAGKTTRSEMAWDGLLKAPGYQDRLLRDDPLKPGETRTIKSFDPQFGKTNIVTLEARGQEEVLLLDGQMQMLLKVTVASSVAPGFVLEEYLDAKGEALVTRMSLLGMSIYKVSREEALKAISGGEADLAVATLIKVAKIDRPLQTTRAVYRLSIPGEDPARLLSTGPTQAVMPIAPGVVELVVTAISPPATTPADSKPAGDEYLVPNDYLQSDDPLVKKYAALGAGAETDPWKISRNLERWVYEKLKRKNFSTLLASAAEVAKDLQGDCTEHAVLLSAMARARGIPSRVAVGLVYVDSLRSFGGHMWSEVHVNGVWVPLDATLGQGGIGADHIKFADSSFSEKDPVAPLSTFLPLVSVLGKLQIDVRETRHK
jgi:Transglutaminase-like superfamily